MGSVVTPVTVSGRYFWAGDKRFVVNGIIYNLDKIKKDQIRVYQDVLASDLYPTLKRSTPLLEELRINTLFVYYIDETKNHDDAMSLLADAGIYVLPCLCGPNRDMDCHGPSAAYTSEFLASCFRTIDEMSRYDNTLGFIIANEWIDCLRKTSASPYLRALTRDVKKYMALNAKLGQRVLPVGISAAPISNLFNTQFEYFSADSEKEAIDFFALNDHSSMSGWAMLMNNAELSNRFSNAHIPVFFSQYGNNNDMPARSFADTRPLYTDAGMLRVFSGGVVNEFFDNPHGCGLVHASTTTRRVKKADDFHTLKAELAGCFPPDLDQYAKLSPADEQAYDFSYDVIKLRGGDDTPEVVATASAQGERPLMPRRTHEWKASHQLPQSPFDWGRLEAAIEELVQDSEWVEIDLDDEQAGNAPDQAIEDLTFGIRDELIVDDDVSIGSDCNNGGRDLKEQSVCGVN